MSETKFTDATGFPVLPTVYEPLWSVGRQGQVKPPSLYWYREDVRVARGRESFWGSTRWMEVQRLLAMFEDADDFDVEYLSEEGFAPVEHVKQLGITPHDEIAFEVGAPRCSARARMSDDHRLPMRSSRTKPTPRKE
jgi:hypothetical protein